MIDPLRQQQLDELEEVEICHDILTNSRNELYLNFRYLDVALSSLGFLADRAGRGVATDGFLIYYQPEHLMSMYKRGRVLINRAFLHMACWAIWIRGENGRSRTGIWPVTLP